MINAIKEINLPAYATLSEATVNISDMGERTITATVNIDGQIKPDFSHDWIVEYRGERYIMPLRQPQASKENTSLDSTIELTFYHEAIYELKRYYFIELTSEESGTAIADKYIASVSLNLGRFCELLERMCKYWYGDKIAVDLNPEWIYKQEPQTIEISYSYIWDVLIKLYELYSVRWAIDSVGNGYVIRIGYPSNEVSHIFEYGFDGGLLKVERQVQDDNIRNILLGRGGERNLPYRYFKQTDEKNASFSPDPDWCPELSNIYFANLHGKTFRDYIRGWNEAHHKGRVYPKEERTWAYLRGFTDEKFAPIEYVKDDESIAKYGELWGGLDNNDEIYPTIQGVSIDPMGRVDECVAVEQVDCDDYIEDKESDATVRTVAGGDSAVLRLKPNEKKTFKIVGGDFAVPKGKIANLDEGLKVIKAKTLAQTWENPLTHIVIETKPQEPVEAFNLIYSEIKIDVIDKFSMEHRSASGITEGKYRFDVYIDVQNAHDEELDVVASCRSPKLMESSPIEYHKNVFNIWIKNIWQTERNPEESAIEYAERVWRPILGDRTGDEAKVIFASGNLSISGDYEFTIVKTPEYDWSKSITLKDDFGNIVGICQSHWKLTLAKSDADYETLGLLVPSTKRQGNSGDYFFFTGIDMPHMYVLWAEQRLDDFKLDELAKIRDIKPTWVITPDKIKWANDDLLESVHVGDVIKLRDKRFIDGNNIMELFIASVTIDYKSDSLNPEIQIVVSDEYTTSGSVVGEIQSEISALHNQIGAISNIERVVQSIGNKIYLRKDGKPDISLSRTEFGSVISSPDFNSGGIAGNGWGIYKDENNDWIIEADGISVRKKLDVNSIVVNQISVVGGREICSCASMEISRIVENEDSWDCYFDERGGSVKNLFQVGDIVLSEKFTPDNLTLKYYKRQIVGVGQNYVRLSKTIHNGDGVPEVGDILVQYGNISDANRRYVKLRDVIGGAYECYIRGLDSVDAQGDTFYIVGVRNGNDPIFRLGGKNSDYIQWKDNILEICGDLSVKSTVGDKPILEYLDTSDLDYIKNNILDATKQSTTISGGLLLASTIQLGYQSQTNGYIVKSGLNGIYNAEVNGKGIAFWAGGSCVDVDDESKNHPNFLVRMDGTAYACGNTIRFGQNQLEVGDSLRFTENGITLYDGLAERLRISNEPIDEDIAMNLQTNSVVANLLVSQTLTIGQGEFAVIKPLGIDTMLGDKIYDGVDPLPIIRPDVESNYVLQGSSQEVWSGKLTNGSLCLNVDVKTSKIPNNFIYPAAFIIVRNSANEVVYSQSLSFQKNTNNELFINKTLSPVLPMNEQLTMTFEIHESGATPKGDTSSLGVSGNIVGLHQMPNAVKTIIGNNGFASVWEESVLFANRGQVTMRSQNFGFRVTAGGLYYMKDGINWHKIDTNKIGG